LSGGSLVDPLPDAIEALPVQIPTKLTRCPGVYRRKTTGKTIYIME
jgi:hypothetical protein